MHRSCRRPRNQFLKWEYILQEEKFEKYISQVGKIYFSSENIYITTRGEVWKGISQQEEEREYMQEAERRFNNLHSGMSLCFKSSTYIQIVNCKQLSFHCVSSCLNLMPVFLKIWNKSCCQGSVASDNFFICYWFQQM